jgi:hypothetical protein
MKSEPQHSYIGYSYKKKGVHLNDLDRDEFHLHMADNVPMLRKHRGTFFLKFDNKTMMRNNIKGLGKRSTNAPNTLKPREIN